MEYNILKGGWKISSENQAIIDQIHNSVAREQRVSGVKSSFELSLQSDQQLPEMAGEIILENVRTVESGTIRGPVEDVDEQPKSPSS